MSVATLGVAALLSLLGPSATAGNIAQWHETGSGWRDGVNNRWAVFTPEIARDLTYRLSVEAPSAGLVGRLRRTVRHAMDAWQTVADVSFREVQAPAVARLDIVVSHDGTTGYHYHGAGTALAPVRGASGRYVPTPVRLSYRGDPDAASEWREDSWVWVAAHELGHALGLWHEFERTDRDRFIRTRPDPLLIGRLAPKRGDSAGTDYDESSLMHYAWTDGDRRPAYDFMRADGISRIASVSFYQRNGFSTGDIKTIRMLYGPANGAVPLVHTPTPISDIPPDDIAGRGWVVRDGADPGSVVFSESGVNVVQERDIADHWLDGGDPPRLERALDVGAFLLTVDVDARYTFAGTHAGIFVVLGTNDWIYFGPFEHPHRIRAQRTGEGLIPLVDVNTHRYRLQVRFQGGTLRASVLLQGRHAVVANFTALRRPESVALGIKSWGPAHGTYRSIRFTNIELSPLTGG